MILYEMDPMLPVYVNAVSGRKAKDIVVLDVRKLTSVADVFLICSGASNRQVTAIADHIRSDLKDRGFRPMSVEGLGEGHWVILDYGHIIIHVFYDPIRMFYDLEGLWSDAVRIPVDAMIDKTSVGDMNGDEKGVED
jgi:ribosome-associated protein